MSVSNALITIGDRTQDLKRETMISRNSFIPTTTIKSQVQFEREKMVHHVPLHPLERTYSSNYQHIQSFRLANPNFIDLIRLIFLFSKRNYLLLALKSAALLVSLIYYQKRRTILATPVKNAQ
jgi:hypothetical protein